MLTPDRRPNHTLLRDAPPMLIVDIIVVTVALRLARKFVAQVQTTWLFAGGDVEDTFRTDGQHDAV
jgi:hypothetical protein